jgi:restriction endonuclease S subunit
MDIPHLSKSEILESYIPLPPEYEQIKIAEKIEVCDSNIQKGYENLEKLSRKKSRLMHDLLTSKFQVNVDDAEVADA